MRDTRLLVGMLESAVAFDKQMEDMLERNQRLIKFIRNQLTEQSVGAVEAQPKWPVRDDRDDYPPIESGVEYERQLLEAIDENGLRYMVDAEGQHYRVWVVYRFEPIKEGALK